MIKSSTPGKTGKSWATESNLHPTLTWNRKVANTSLEKFQKIVEEKYNERFDSYWEFHRWSVENSTKFWGEVWNYLDIIYSKPYDQVLVKTGPGFLDNIWFSGALFNYAENILRNRDHSVAIMCLDEHGNEDSVTFAEMFEEVKLYAAAFRQNGLKKGDTVACYMSNRKEAIFAFLAVTSVGAIWGGPLPYFGARASSNIVKMLEPKFLIAVDSHFDEGREMRLVDYLPFIVDNAPSLEKVILVVTQEQTLEQDLSNIRNCVLLEDFLQEGRTPDGAVPDIVFEQLPFDHPICINHTSGTSGLPKGPVHSAGTLISQLKDFAIHMNLKRGDVIGTVYPVGWSLWDYFVPNLALGCKLFLYCGSVCHTTQGTNWWDKVAKYKVKLTLLITTMVDRFEKMGLLPSPDSNLESLEMVTIGGMPVKRENFDYIRTKIKDVFVGSSYGATEVYGTFSGFVLNMPVYGGEIQAPSLGMDVQCFNEDGKPVVGERGELVVCTPAPNFPIFLWKDTDNEKLKSTYLSKYPGVWSQNDACWINPKTRGIIVIGRSDDTMKQNGELFGSEDVYFAIHSMDELQDYICVGQQKHNGDSRVVLFVKLRPGLRFTPELKAKIERVIDKELWWDCVPEVILPVPDIPYNLNNKRMESTVRKIVQTNKIPEVMNIKNPASLKHFLDIPEIVCYNQE